MDAFGTLNYSCTAKRLFCRYGDMDIISCYTDVTTTTTSTTTSVRMWVCLNSSHSVPYKALDFYILFKLVSGPFTFSFIDLCDFVFLHTSGTPFPDILGLHVLVWSVGLTPRLLGLFCGIGYMGLFFWNTAWFPLTLIAAISSPPLLWHFNFIWFSHNSYLLWRLIQDRIVSSFFFFLAGRTNDTDHFLP